MGHQAVKRMFASLQQPVLQSVQSCSFQAYSLASPSNIASLQAYVLSKLHISDLTALKLVFYSQNVCMQKPTAQLDEPVTLNLVSSLSLGSPGNPYLDRAHNRAHNLDYDTL